jgi:hypothetical protein
MQRERLFWVWHGMRQRCENPNAVNYKNYGANGIKVCEEWKSYENFRIWAIEYGYNPEAKRGECTLDRIDLKKGYSPENCRWITIQKQQLNRTNSHLLTINGVTKTIKEWATETGIKQNTLLCRFRYGVPEERLLEPIEERKERNTHFCIVNGKKVSISDLAKRLNMNYNTLWSRIKRGWTIEKILSNK